MHSHCAFPNNRSLTASLRLSRKRAVFAGQLLLHSIEESVGALQNPGAHKYYRAGWSILLSRVTLTRKW